MVDGIPERRFRSGISRVEQQRIIRQQQLASQEVKPTAQTEEEFKKQEGERQVEVINQRISEFKQREASLRERAREKSRTATTPEEAEEADELFKEADRQKEFADQFERIKPQAKTGEYELQSLINVAVAKGERRQFDRPARISIRKIPAEKYKLTRREPTSAEEFIEGARAGAEVGLRETKPKDIVVERFIETLSAGAKEIDITLRKTFPRLITEPKFEITRETAFQEFPITFTKPLELFGKGVETIATPITEQIIGKKLDKSTKRQTQLIAQDVAIFGLFEGAGVLRTTAQLQRTLPQVQRVKFRGIEQESQVGLTKTIATFEAQTGERGIVKALTKSQITDEGIQKSLTFAVGKTGRPAVRVPSAEPVLLQERQFIGLQRAISRPKEIDITRGIVTLRTEGFEQIIKGVVAKSPKGTVIERGLEFPTGKIISRIRRGTEIEKFVGAARGFARDETTFLFGKTISPRGEVLSAGKIQRLTKVPDTEITVARVPRQFRPAQISLQIEKKIQSDLSGLISASLPKIVKTPSVTARIAPAGIRPITRVTTRQVTRPTQISKSIQNIEKQATADVTKTLTVPRVEVRTRAAIRQQAKQRQISEQIVNQVSKIESRTQQRRLTVLRLRVKSEAEPTIKLPPLITISPIKYPIIPIIPIDFKRRRRRKKEREFRPAIAERIFIPSFTAQQLGITKLVEAKDIERATSKLESGIKLRPIPILR